MNRGICVSALIKGLIFWFILGSLVGVAQGYLMYGKDYFDYEHYLWDEWAQEAMVSWLSFVLDLFVLSVSCFVVAFLAKRSPITSTLFFSLLMIVVGITLESMVIKEVTREMYIMRGLAYLLYVPIGLMMGWVVLQLRGEEPVEVAPEEFGRSNGSGNREREPSIEEMKEQFKARNAAYYDQLDAVQGYVDTRTYLNKRVRNAMIAALLNAAFAGFLVYSLSKPCPLSKEPFDILGYNREEFILVTGIGIFFTLLFAFGFWIKNRAIVSIMLLLKVADAVLLYVSHGVMVGASYIALMYFYVYGTIAVFQYAAFKKQAVPEMPKQETPKSVNELLFR